MQVKDVFVPLQEVGRVEHAAKKLNVFLFCVLFFCFCPGDEFQVKPVNQKRSWRMTGNLCSVLFKEITTQTRLTFWTPDREGKSFVFLGMN